MIRTVQVKDAGQIRDLCHQALGYDSALEKVAAQIDKFNRTLHYNKKDRALPILIHYFQKSLLRFISLIAYVFVKDMGFFSMRCRI